MSIEIEPVKPKGIYALKVKSSAEELGLGFELYSYLQIINTKNNDADFFTEFARLTGTRTDEQLKFILVSDAPLDDAPDSQHEPHPAIAVIPSEKTLDYAKLEDILAENSFYKDKKLRKGKFSPRKADPKAIGMEAGRVGISSNVCFPQNYVPVGEKFQKDVLVPYVFDKSIGDALKICFPIGRGNTDDVAVISGYPKLGDYLIPLFDNIIGEAYFFGEICKPSNKSPINALQTIVCSF